jgi:Zn-dependent protease
MPSIELHDVLRLFVVLPLFILSLSVHEFAHAWMAKRCGDTTAEEQGRLTLDPGAHLDPLGTLFFIIASLIGFGFGWAKPVPVTLSRCREPLKAMLWIALAGPLSNLIQALLCVPLLILLGFLGANLSEFTIGGVELVLQGGAAPVDIATAIVGYYLLINLVLMIFNLLPLPPLDGGRVVVSLAPWRVARSFAALEPYGFLILLVLMLLGVLKWWLMLPLGAILSGLDMLFRVLGLG